MALAGGIMRAVHCLAVGLLTATLVAPSAARASAATASAPTASAPTASAPTASAPTASAPTAQTIAREEFTAILTNISNVGGTGLTPVTIRITRWTPDEENLRLLDTLREKGQNAFLEKLLDVKPVGSIATPTSLRYDFFYARETAGDGGERRIMLISDRPMNFAERVSGSRSRDYPFTVIELRLDKEGRGEGTLAQAVQLKLIGNFLGIENLATSPMKLGDVKKVK
jgi:hypothetical protein